MLLPLIVLILGILGANYFFPPNEISPVIGHHSFCGEVESVKELPSPGQRLIIKIDSVDGSKFTSFKASVRTLTLLPVILEGDRVQFRCKLNNLPPIPDIPDVIDINKSLRRNGVVAYASSVLADSICVTGKADGLMTMMRRLNYSLLNRLASADISTESFRLASAMFLGRADEILPSDRNAYSAAGLSHLLALSGTHVAVITWLISIAFFPFYIARRRSFAYVASILLLWGYALLTGLSPSVVRSVIMATIYLVARMLERRSVPMNSLCAAAFFILLFRPSDLFAPGFQMSFAAVAGIILFFPLINQISRRNHPWLYRLWSYPALSISATILTSIVAAWHFHTFPLWFLPANLLAIPLVPLIVIGAILLLLFPHWGLLCTLFDWITSALQWVAQTVSNLPGSLQSDIYLPLWLTILLLVLPVIFACGLHYKRPAISIAAVLLIVASVSVHAVSPSNYASSEYFRHEDYRHSQIILRSGDQLLLFTSASLPEEQLEKLDYYKFILRDYMGRRSLDSITLAPKGNAIVFGTDTIPIKTSGER